MKPGDLGWPCDSRRACGRARALVCTALGCMQGTVRGSMAGRWLRGLEVCFAERGLLFGELLPLPPPSPLPFEVPMGARLPARELPAAM